MTTALRHFLRDDDLSPDELLTVLDLADTYKTDRTGYRPLVGKAVAVIFEKNSTRTRLSFEVGISQLGGQPVIVDGRMSQLGREETIEDTSRVLSRYVDAVAIRTFAQRRINALASTSSVPVINALTDEFHPCQVLLRPADHPGAQGPAGRRHADLPRRRGQQHGPLADARRGECRSDSADLVAAGLRPERRHPARRQASGRRDRRRHRADRRPATRPSTAPMCWSPTPGRRWARRTTAWTGSARSGRTRSTPRLLGRADGDAIVLHCLPAHRGWEITDEVIDGPASAVWDEAENRLHAQKALLAFLVAEHAGSSSLREFAEARP